MVAFVNFVDFGVFVAAVDSGNKCRVVKMVFPISRPLAN